MCWQIMIHKSLNVTQRFHHQRFQGPAALFIKVHKDINMHMCQRNTSMGLLLIIYYMLSEYTSTKREELQWHSLFTWHTAPQCATFYMALTKQDSRNRRYLTFSHWISEKYLNVSRRHFRQSTYRSGLKILLFKSPFVFVVLVIDHVLFHYFIFFIKQKVTGSTRSCILHVIH